MARQKNDGRGRIAGGRAKGTPNKDKPLKAFLREHSLEYFTPNKDETDEDGNPTGRIVSQFDLDLRKVQPAARIKAETDLLRYHTPQMQATAIDVAASEGSTLADRLARLAKGEDIRAEEEE